MEKILIYYYYISFILFSLKTDIKVPAKYGARIGLSFSATLPMILKSQSYQVAQIKDVKSESCDLFSD